MNNNASLGHHSFVRLVTALKAAGKTCVVVEQCCGGLITAGMMGQPGASQVLVGGSVIYNTKLSKPLLLNNDALYDSIRNGPPPSPLSPTTGDYSSSTLDEETYVASKRHWTTETSVAFCQNLKTDYAIAEGGAAGPTFRPKGMTKGFAVVAIAGHTNNGQVSLLHQEVVRSNHANRQRNMNEFANAAADALYRVVVAMQEASSSSSSVSAQIDSTSATATTIGATDIKNALVMSTVLALDRATHLRSNADALEKMEAQSSTHYLVLHKNKIYCNDDSLGPKHVGRHDIDALIQGKEYRKSFLGIAQSNQSALFSLDILDEDFATSNHPSLIRLLDTRTCAPLFSQAFDREAVLYATALAQWQRKTRYCSQCGGEIRFIHAGSCAQCVQCHVQSWPRQDPSMIAVILSPDRERVLLAHSKRHPPKVYTTLAGFVEAGETMEAAVVREAWEEAGVRVDIDSVRYFTSQPWPFPQSTMLGFSGIADDLEPLNIDKNEIECAQWFDKRYVLEAAKASAGLATLQNDVAKALLAAHPDLKLILPSKGVIARQLIDAWLEDRLHY